MVARLGERALALEGLQVVLEQIDELRVARRQRDADRLEREGPAEGLEAGAGGTQLGEVAGLQVRQQCRPLGASPAAHGVRRGQEMRPHELPVALLVLRVGLGVFLLLWSIDKAPEQTAKIFRSSATPPARELR